MIDDDDALAAAAAAAALLPVEALIVPMGLATTSARERKQRVMVGFEGVLMILSIIMVVYLIVQVSLLSHLLPALLLM